MLDSLYNTEQFTFFLSLCPFPCLYIWTLKRSLFEWSPVSPFSAGFPLPRVLHFFVDPHNMGVLIFSPFPSSFSHPCLPKNGSAPDLSTGTSVRCVCRVPHTYTPKLGVELCHAFSCKHEVIRLFAICSRVSVHTLCTMYKTVRYDSDSWRTTWTVYGIRIWEGVA